MNNDLRDMIESSVVGQNPLNGEVLTVVKRSIAKRESVKGVMPCNGDEGLVATDSRVFVAKKKGIKFECRYDAITKLKVETSWFTRGVRIETESDNQYCSTGDEAAVVAMYNVIRSAMPGVNEGVLGGEMPSDMVLGVIGDATQSDEAIVGIMVTTDGNALVATEQRLLIATQQGLECDCVYEDITAFEVRTGWLKRGISFISSRGDFECATEDGDAVVVMGNIIRGRTPHIDSPVIAEDGGGLVGKVKGMFDTATGGDIRRYEEFVDTATDVLVGLHRDQATAMGKLVALENSVEAVRRSQDEINTRLTRVDAAIVELCEHNDAVSTLISGVEAGFSELRASQSEVVGKLGTTEQTVSRLTERVPELLTGGDAARPPEAVVSGPAAEGGGGSMNRTALVASVVAVLVSVLSLVLRFV